jgi:hypothetical protein
MWYLLVVLYSAYVRGSFDEGVFENAYHQGQIHGEFPENIF